MVNPNVTITLKDREVRYDLPTPTLPYCHVLRPQATKDDFPVYSTNNSNNISLKNVNVNYHKVLQKCLFRCNFNHYKARNVRVKNKRI